MVSMSWHLHNVVIQARPVHHNSVETWSLEVSTLKVFYSMQLAQITLFAHLRVQKAEQLFCFLKIIFALVRINQASPFWLVEQLLNIEYIRKREKVHAQRRTRLHENTCVPMYALTEQYTFVCMCLFVLKMLLELCYLGEYRRVQRNVDKLTDHL